MATMQVEPTMEEVSVQKNMVISIPEWATGDFGACDTTCGYGTMFREVTCPTYDADPASEPCDEATEPFASEPCDDGSGCPAFDLYCPLGYQDKTFGHGCEAQAAAM